MIAFNIHNFKFMFQIRIQKININFLVTNIIDVIIVSTLISLH